MELLSVIRRWHYRDHFSIRETSRRTGLSRNTVRKYLRSDAVEPKFNIPDRPSKLAPYADKLSQMLRQEAGKSRKQKRTTKQLHTDLAPRLRRLLQSRGGLRSRLEGRPAAGTAEVRPRRSSRERTARASPDSAQAALGRTYSRAVPCRRERSPPARANSDGRTDGRRRFSPFRSLIFLCVAKGRCALAQALRLGFDESC